MSPKLFERQMESLVARGYSPIPLSQIFRDPSVERPIVLTFDDGYENFYSNALPILARLGFAATVFLVSNCLGGNNAWDTIRGDVSERLMTTAQVREAVRVGVEFGSHTLDHADLSAISINEARRQVVESRDAIEDVLGERVVSFCYPYGRKTQAVRDIVEEVGYEVACGVFKGSNTPETDRFDLHRVNVRSNTSVPVLYYKMWRDVGRQK